MCEAGKYRRPEIGKNRAGPWRPRHLIADIRNRIYTVPEFLEQRFSPAVRTTFSAFMIVLSVLAKVSISLWASSIVFKEIGRFPSLFIYLQNVQAYMMMPFAGIFFLGVLWKRATAAGVLACTAAVCVVAPLLMLNGQKHFLPFMEHPLLRPWLHSAMVAFAVCMLVLVAVSLLTKPTEKAKLARTTIYGQADVQTQADASSGMDRVGPLRDYRLWLSALLAGTTVLWWWMR
ncbi:MAG: hypothetical protein ACLQNE_46860 [Thermoguttaceae bacterium]